MSLEQNTAPAPPDWSIVPVNVDWSTVTGESRTRLTTHVWTAPQQRKGQPLADKIYKALEDFDAEYVRFLPWFPHPRIAVPEIEAPTDKKTSWDFSLLDPYVEDFMRVNEGKPVVANFATIPRWMFNVENPTPLPEDPYQDFWQYEEGTEFRDPSLQEVADYFYRLASWYIKGGFTDELGVYHESGHSYKFAYWEVLCEPNLTAPVGHSISPETYTKLYDMIVERLQELDPDMKFIGLSLAHAGDNPEYYWNFLNKGNHKESTPIDAISYHFYASADLNNLFVQDQNAPFSEWRGIFFAQADGFLQKVDFVNSIKQRLNPKVETHINEIGTYSPDFMNPAAQFPEIYWPMSAAHFAYVWAGLVERNVELVSIAELFDYPGMFAGTTLVNWETGEPNQRYWAAKLLLDNFGPGDKLVSTFAGMQEGNYSRIFAQGYMTKEGHLKLLLVNKLEEAAKVVLPQGMKVKEAKVVDLSTGEKPPKDADTSNGMLELDAFGVSVVTFEA